MTKSLISIPEAQALLEAKCKNLGLGEPHVTVYVNSLQHNEVCAFVCMPEGESIGWSRIRPFSVEHVEIKIAADCADKLFADIEQCVTHWRERNKLSKNDQ